MHAQSPAFTHFEQNNSDSDSLTTPQQSLSVTSKFLLFTIGSTMFLNIRWSMYITWKPPTSHWHTVWLPTWKWTFYVIKLAFWINAIRCAVHWTRWTLTLTSQCWLWKLVCIVEPSHNTCISKRFYLSWSSYACKSLISAGNGGLSRLCVPRSIDFANLHIPWGLCECWWRKRGKGDWQSSPQSFKHVVSQTCFPQPIQPKARLNAVLICWCECMQVQVCIMRGQCCMASSKRWK